MPTFCQTLFWLNFSDIARLLSCYEVTIFVDKRKAELHRFIHEKEVAYIEEWA